MSAFKRRLGVANGDLRLGFGVFKVRFSSVVRVSNHLRVELGVLNRGADFSKDVIHPSAVASWRPLKMNSRFLHQNTVS